MVICMVYIQSKDPILLFNFISLKERVRNLPKWFMSDLFEQIYNALLVGNI